MPRISKVFFIKNSHYTPTPTRYPKILKDVTFYHGTNFRMIQMDQFVHFDDVVLFKEHYLHHHTLDHY